MRKATVNNIDWEALSLAERGGILALAFRVQYPSTIFDADLLLTDPSEWGPSLMFGTAHRITTMISEGSPPTQ